MAQTFFFYDLETSGVNPRTSRIMQFAGQRTDADLNPIGEPYNILIKLNEDILPEPDAILITGITPQQTIQDGITEAEFFKLFCEEIVQPDTIFVGFNNIRFDDEFVRFGLYRNFYDPYEWQWKDGCTRWDMLDVVRMTRALRPNGIKWPFAPDGKPSNRLELLSAVNKLIHDSAHDALSDVSATISVAKMIKDKQPKLFDYLLSMRGKKEVMALVNSGQPYVYVSGKYANEFEKLTVVHTLGQHPDKQGALVYDLRIDPEPFLKLTPEQLAEAWKWKKDPKPSDLVLPIKALQYNRCPAVAPLGVILPEDAARLGVYMDEINAHKKKLDDAPGLIDSLRKALAILNKDRTQSTMMVDDAKVDGLLYEEFIGDADKKLYPKIHQIEPEGLSNIANELKDRRLKVLMPLYKARNFPKNLSDDERQEWEKHKTKMLSSSLPKFSERLNEIALREGLTQNQAYLLEELKLYAESIIPTDL
jgi:exodeoxyribonuclease I